MQKHSLLLLLLVAFCFPLGLQSNEYPWLDETGYYDTLELRILPPAGFIRTEVSGGSFASWLRGLPLKHEGAPVRLHNGFIKNKPEVHHSVIDIDTGPKDLQQCADAVMRLRAEYLYSHNQIDSIHFNFTSGDKAAFSQWKKGYRPVVRGNKVRWRNGEQPDGSYGNFRKYMDSVFTYAGSYSLSQELLRQNIRKIEAGNVFIKGGFPGHAVMVMDTAVDPATGEKLFLLSQSYMPAQDIHILNNPDEPAISPWYRLPHNGQLVTPEWKFKSNELKRFKPQAIDRLMLSSSGQKYP